MAITAICTCGKRIGLADVMAGRTVSCPKCERDVFVPVPGATKAGENRPGASSQKAKKPAAPKVAISPTLVTAAIIGGGLLIVFLVFYFGPWRVGSQWAAISDRANDEVTDVVLFSIQAYESQNGMYDASKSHRIPSIEGPASFVPPMMAFTMPKNIIFLGKTNQGNYSGTYDPVTGEIVANIEIGGFSVAGLVDVRKASGKFQITGREKNGKPEAEVDGEPLKIVIRKHSDDE